MSPAEPPTLGEVHRAVERLEKAISEMRLEAREARSESLPREVWDEWRIPVQQAVADLVAAQARHEREHHDAHSRIYRHVDDSVGQERASRVAGERWAIGLAVTSVLGVIGLVLNAAGLGTA